MYIYIYINIVLLFFYSFFSKVLECLPMLGQSYARTHRCPHQSLVQICQLGFLSWILLEIGERNPADRLRVSYSSS